MSVRKNESKFQNTASLGTIHLRRRQFFTIFDPYPQIREQMSGPDLYVLTVGFLALKKPVFSEKKNSSQKKSIFYGGNPSFFGG